MMKPSLPAHIDELLQYLQTLPILLPPSPWGKRGTYGVGGLFAVGYSEQSDLLLVLSSQGRGIFDCGVGTKLARDAADVYLTFNEVTLMANGFGPLAGQQVRIAGLYGGGLPNSTRDGWHLEAVPLLWPQYSIILEPPSRSMYVDKTHAVRVGENGACELRAYGFSPTGQSFVIATSCEVNIFARVEGVA